MIDKIKPKSEFSRNVLTLMTGTTIAQAIPIAISPILTRLYSPEDFGIFAVFSSIVILLCILSAGRYEMAIILPKKNEDANNILILSLVLVSLFSIIVFLLIFTFYDFLISIKILSNLGFYLYLIAPMIFLTSIFQIFYNWLNRQKEYKKLAISKVTQTSSTAITNIFLGIKEILTNGLIIGQFIGQIITTVYLFVKTKNTINFNKITNYEIKMLMKKYSNFPKFDVLSSFLNALSLQLPIILLGFLFTPAVVGLFAFSRRIVGLPITLLSSSVTTVFKQTSTNDYNKYGNCTKIYKKTLISLIKIGILPSIFLFLFAPVLFEFIFGKEWREAGVYTQILVPMFFLRFISSPLTYIFYITNNHKLNLIGQILLLIFSSAGLFFGYLVNSIITSLLFFAIGLSLIYLYYLYKSYILSKGIINDKLS